jgi:outer membrane protein TolC
LTSEEKSLSKLQRRGKTTLVELSEMDVKISKQQLKIREVQEDILNAKEDLRKLR